ncbi:MAG: hypothetical protein HYZ30_00850 [Candidatus Azosocius agrarius]|nr:MAG: hypothetical protein HYZ30_00850 [Gammaproteobacteria bacterium]
MINNIIIKINLYGFFKKYNMEYIFLSIPYNCNIKLLRKIFLDELITINKFINVDEILNCSIFANNTDILNDDYVLVDKEELILFPPVNGG